MNQSSDPPLQIFYVPVQSVYNSMLHNWVPRHFNQKITKYHTTPAFTNKNMHTNRIKVFQIPMILIILNIQNPQKKKKSQ
uniref:Uncharacterized protein n=1 Tax=Rhizophora mucronata TaxID=61149 RepID=A0A2P2N6H3_RHIMU